MRKKTGFQKTGKEGGEFYSAPTTFKEMTGMYGITENGIGLYSENRFDKAYICTENAGNVFVSNAEKVKGCTRVLRDTNVKFCFYEISEIEEHTLLLISIFTKELSDAERAFANFEKEIQEKGNTFGITIKGLTAEEKLSLFHRLIMADSSGAKTNVTQYLAKTSGWLPDFELRHCQEKDRCLITGKVHSNVMYIRRIPAEYASVIYRTLKRTECCRMLVTTYEPVSEQEVMSQIQNNYMGFDSLLYKLKRKKVGIGKIAEEKPERRYLYAGIYFVLSCKDSNRLQEEKEKLQNILRKYGSEAAEYCFYQKEALQKLSFLNPWVVQQMRLIQIQSAAGMNPFYQDEKELAEDEMDEKSELLAAFDSIIS